tara:strand:+ start:1201 stop:1503 length:303 start_codon:yes stop_codon:yes gene_type:complete
LNRLCQSQVSLTILSGAIGVDAVLLVIPTSVFTMTATHRELCAGEACVLRATNTVPQSVRRMTSGLDSQEAQRRYVVNPKVMSSAIRLLKDTAMLTHAFL